MIFNNKVKKELDVQLVHTFCHQKTVWCVNFSQDGERLVAGCFDGKAYVYDVQTGTLICVLYNLLAPRNILRTVCFSRDGKYLATGSWEGDLYIWEVDTKSVRNAFKGHSLYIRSLEFSPNGRLLVSASHDNTVRVWNMRDGAGKLLTENNPICLDNPCYSSATFSPDGRYVAASHRDGVVRIWDVRTGRLMRRMLGHAEWVYGVVFMPDGKGLMSGGWDKTLKYWDVSSLSRTMKEPQREPTTSGVEQSRPDREFSGHKHSINSISISHDGRWVASGSSRDQSVRIWDSRNGVLQCILNHDHRVWTVDFSPAGCYLASGGGDGTTRIWRYSDI